MATEKYIIIGDDGNPVGHLLLKSQNPTFQHTTASNPIPTTGPIADGALFIIVLGGLTMTPWLMGAPGWVAALCGVGITSLLAGIKAWRGSLSVKTNDAGGAVTIKGEFTNADDGTIHLDEIIDTEIDHKALVRLCQAIEANDFVWVGRPTAKLKWGVGRAQHTRIRYELERLNYIVSKNGQDQLNGRGRLFVRKIGGLAAGGGWLRGNDHRQP